MSRHKTFLIATPGGHIDELYELAPRLAEVGSDRVWLTEETAQTRSLLAHENVIWVPGVGARQGLRALRTVPTALAAIRRHRPDLIVSTGAALSVPYLVTGRLHRIPVHYIESATRLHGPSVTGRIMELVPGVTRHHQAFMFPRSGWRDIGNVFDAFRSVPACDVPAHKVVVTVGTERFPFSRALASVQDALPSSCDVLWQTGHTSYPDLEGEVRAWFPSPKLNAAVSEADLVITHAGVGSVLMALRSGLHPLIIPRQASLGEHVDDHQVELARYLEERGLATVAGPHGDLRELMHQCMLHRIVRSEGAPLQLTRSMSP